MGWTCSVADLTALVLIGQPDNDWHVHPTFWLPREALHAKARRDQVPYDTWERQGFLITTPAPASSISTSQLIFVMCATTTIFAGSLSIGGTSGT